MYRESKKHMIKNIIIAVLLLVCVGETALLALCVSGSGGVSGIVKLYEIRRVINRYFLDDVDEEQLKASTYKGMMEGLDDPYSTYYTKEEYEDLTESMEGVFSGIGAVLQRDAEEGTIKVVRVIEGSPAEEAGVKADDILYKIEGEEVASDEDLSEVVSRVKGEEGTEVNLTFLRGKEELDFTITRKKIQNPTVAYEMLDSSVGYIQITEFEEVTVQQFRTALTELKKEGMKKLVLDLRDNPGGLLSSVLNVADQIIDGGLVLYTEDKNGKKEEYRVESEEALNMPLAVLINENSASASEVLAGAIQDYGAGTLVGTTSFGKGIVQTTIRLLDGSAVKLTVSHYFTPKGRDIHKKGITPDVEVEADEALEEKSVIEKSEDNQLQKAIEVLEEEQ